MVSGIRILGICFVAVIVLLLLLLRLSFSKGEAGKDQSTSLPSQPSSAISTVEACALSQAPSFEQIQQDIHRLIEEEKARTGRDTYDYVAFSHSPPFVQYSESIRGKFAIQWKGRAFWVDIVELASRKIHYFIEVNISEREVGLGTVPNRKDVYLNDVPLEQVSKLMYWQNPEQMSRTPEETVFSGIISAVQPNGLVTLTNVTIDTQN